MSGRRRILVRPETAPPKNSKVVVVNSTVYRSEEIARQKFSSTEGLRYQGLWVVLDMSLTPVHVFTNMSHPDIEVLGWVSAEKQWSHV